MRASCMKRRSPGASLSGYMWKESPSGEPARASSSCLSPGESRVADGMAMALRPEESIAQQSEHPSVSHSSSPFPSLGSMGRL